MMETTSESGYQALLPEIVNRILAVSDPSQIILFGSYARGDWGPDSDVDLLVVMEHVESQRGASIDLRRALRGLLVPVDVLVTTPEHLAQHRDTIGLIYQPMLEEGKILYARTR